MISKMSFSKKNYHGTKNGPNGSVYCSKSKNLSHGKRELGFYKHLRMFGLAIGLIGFFFLLDSLMLSTLHYIKFHSRELQDVRQRFEEKTEKIMYGRLLSLATAITRNETQNVEFSLWEEPHGKPNWKPCANKQNYVNPEQEKTNSGFILVSANGGLNQQRVAICNAIAVSALLNATLVLPRFLYSTVWKDPSQFGDIYQEEYFLNYMKHDVNIVKELPAHLQSIDFEEIGSQITDLDIMKEAKPEYYIQVVLPLLRRNGAVHFLGFGNRLAFDPLPLNLQRLRCKCNFHALKFVPEIQKVGSLLVRRIRKFDSGLTELDRQLFGNHMLFASSKLGHKNSRARVKYLALHMRFEQDMVAYSLCDFGGGERERRELQAYRELHFPTLIARIKNISISPEELRSSGKCPLTPEEAGLMLSALGYKTKTYIYLAGSHVYGGPPRLRRFTKLYPNLVTKEDLLSPSELAPFMNFSSQLAALDFIACASSDVFAMTDSGSQLSSLVTGYRIYHGNGLAPTLRPNKKRFAKILSEEKSIDWGQFEKRVMNMIEENQGVSPRGRGRSIYRLPRTPGCMCRSREL